MPLLVTLQWPRLAVPAETPAARCPPCLNGLTFPSLPPWSHICRHASMVTHLPAMPQWSHICRHASMGTHLTAMPQWVHNTLHASRADQLPPRHHIHPEIRLSAVSLLPLGLVPRLSCFVIQRAVKRGGGLYARTRCVWQSATHIDDVARLTI